MKPMDMQVQQFRSMRRAALAHPLERAIDGDEAVKGGIVKWLEKGKTAIGLSVNY